jgi:Tol biopolymer transport system component
MARRQFPGAFAILATLTATTFAQQSAKPVVPNALRVQSAANPDDGQWIAVPNRAYVGSPMFSPDGDWLAFDAYEAGSNRSECWVSKTDGSEMRQLTQGATPRWSPDGESLIFMREDQDDPSNDQGMFVIKRDGTGERRVGDGRWPDWSPDGKRIAFSLGGRRGRFGGSRVFARVQIADSDGSNRKEIADGDCPTWSPDGKWLVCCQQDPAYPAPLLRAVEVNSDRQIILGMGWFRANWTPDGKSVVAYGPGPSGALSMIRFSLATPGRPEAFLASQRGLAPAYSKDGKKLVLVGEYSRDGKD